MFFRELAQLEPFKRNLKESEKKETALQKQVKQQKAQIRKLEGISFAFSIKQTKFYLNVTHERDLSVQKAPW